MPRATLVLESRLCNAGAAKGTSLPSMKAVLPWKGWVLTALAASVISTPMISQPAYLLLRESRSDTRRSRM